MDAISKQPPEAENDLPHGLKVLQSMIEGRITPPSMAITMNFRLDEVSEGVAVFRGAPTRDHYNPAGVIHGGWASTILDSALGCAVQTSLKEGEGYTTVEFKVNLVRPMTHETGEVTCTANLVSRGRRIATSEARLVDANGKLIAHGTETCIILEAR